MSQLRFEIQGKEVTLDITPHSTGWEVRLPDGSLHRITAHRLPEGLLQISETAAGREDQAGPARTFRAAVSELKQEIQVAMEGQVYSCLPLTGEKRTRRAAKETSGLLAAPMAGLVADVLVQEGQQVSAFQPLAVVEAMKVMSTLEAPFAGTVSKLFVRKGERVEHGASLVQIEKLPGIVNSS